MATLVNKNTKTLILHIPKTGGTARDRFFRRHGFTQHYPRTGHVRLCDIEKGIGIDPSNYTVIAVIRNPFERELSHWSFSRDNADLARPGNQFDAPQHHDTVNTFVWSWQCSPLWYYERFWYWKWYFHADCPDSIYELGRQDAYEYWYSVDGKIPNNVHVVKLEEQNKRLSEILGYRVLIKRGNESNHKHWRAEFDECGIDGVKTLYQRTLPRYYGELLKPVACS